MTIPIGLRTRNRPVYLDLTLRSLLATDLGDVEILVLDDCSDDPLTKEYLSTDDVIELPEPHVWPESGPFVRFCGELPTSTNLRGVKSKVRVESPESRKGVRGGIFWCIDYLMESFPGAEYVMVIEADAVFNKDWFTATENAYSKTKDQKGPNGSHLGLLTAYDRRPPKPPRGPSMGWTWRSVKKLSSGNWGCGNGIGGVHYLVTRAFYESCIPSMKKKYNPALRSGDTSLQALCGAREFSIAATTPSFIQHIGMNSLAWPSKGWRHARNFLKPFVLAEEI